VPASSVRGPQRPGGNRARCAAADKGGADSERRAGQPACRRQFRLHSALGGPARPPGAARKHLAASYVRHDQYSRRPAPLSTRNAGTRQSLRLANTAKVAAKVHGVGGPDDQRKAAALPKTASRGFGWAGVESARRSTASCDQSVLHLSLGQRRLVGGATVHRPLGAVECSPLAAKPPGCARWSPRSPWPASR